MKNIDTKITTEEHEKAIEPEFFDFATILNKDKETTTDSKSSKDSKKSKSTNKPIVKASSILVNAFDLYNTKIEETPKLFDPFFQKVGLASIVGSSDTGKSSLLRQLALSVALGKDEFIGFKLNTDTQNVIYVSTEDDKYSTNASIKMQLKGMGDTSNMESLKHLNFIFDTENLYNNLKLVLTTKKVDLIVIDTFADVFNKEINSNTQVRQFLSKYHKLALKHECLILFLHHNGKRTEKGKPSKNNIIGSQAFEAKMRSVLDLSQSRTKNHRNLTLLKCNFLSSDYKNKSYVLKFNENLVFENTNTQIAINNLYTKKENPAIIKEVLKLHKEEKLSTRKIEAQLKGTKLEVSKSVIGEIIKSTKKGS